MKIYLTLVSSILLSALPVGAVSAQSWTVNGVNQQTPLTSSATESAVAVDPANGFVSVKTAGVGPSVTLSANASSVIANGVITLSWTTSGFGNNLSCLRISSPDLIGWSATSTIASGSVSLTMPSSAQAQTLILRCTADNGSAGNFTTVNVLGATGIELSVSPSCVPPVGGNHTVSWNSIGFVRCSGPEIACASSTWTQNGFLATAGSLPAVTCANAPAPGNYPITLSCINAQGQSQAQTTQLTISNNCPTVTPSGAGWSVNGSLQPTQLITSAVESAVAIDPLSAATAIQTTGPRPSVTLSAGSPAQVGTSSTVSWTASDFTGNLNCTRSSNVAVNGWSGSSPLAAGAINVSMPNTPQTVTLTLNCVAENGSAVNSTTVLVTEPDMCATRPPAVFGSPRTLINKSFFSIWNTNFPGLFGTTYGAGVPGIADGTVIAYSFVAPFNNTIEGYLTANFSPEAGGRGSLAAGFSECPGEISALTPTCDPGVFKIRSEWTTANRPEACNLVPGRTYYYNLSIENSCVSGPEPGTPGGVCSFRLQSRRYF